MPDKEECETCPRKGTLDCQPRFKFRQIMWALYGDCMHKFVPLSYFDAITLKIFDEGFHPTWVGVVQLAPTSSKGNDASTTQMCE